MDYERLYLDIINFINDGVYFVDRERRIRLWNDAAYKISGYTKEEIIGKKCQETGLNHIDLEGKPLCLLACPLAKTMADGSPRSTQVFLRHKDGHRIPIAVKSFPVMENNEIIGAVEVFSINSSVVYDDRLVDNLTRAAMTDTLTSLYNRRMGESFLSHKLEEQRLFGKPFALIYADIDDFSMINNKYGHDMGDAVLKNISGSLRASVRKNDMVCRWGGEEFIGIYSIANSSEAQIIAERFRALVETSYTKLNDNLIHSTISVGATVSRGDDTLDSIIKRADELLYLSKKNGKNLVTYNK